MEALTITGPAKNLLTFAGQLSTHSEGFPPVDLSVLTFDRPSASPDVFVRAVETAGIVCHRLPERRTGDFSVLPKLRRIFGEQHPDIVQTHGNKSHFLLRVAGLERHTRWLAFHHGFTARDWKDKTYNHLSRWAMKGAAHVVTVCEAFKQDLTSSGIPRSRISVCHNSVTPAEPLTAQQRADLRQSLGIPPSVPVLLAIGRLSTEKGHRDLLDAIALLHRDRPFLLVIVGDGPERGRLRTQAEALDLSRHVVFAGHQQEVAPYYGVADIFVLPSHSEGSSNVLLEAMAAGLPIAATGVGGTVDLVSDGDSALLVKAHDSQAMAAALDRLLKDQALASHLAARARAASFVHTPVAYARSILAIYQALLDGTM